MILVSECDHTLLKVTDPNGISANMIKNTISRQISDRGATRFFSFFAPVVSVSHVCR